MTRFHSALLALAGGFLVVASSASAAVVDVTLQQLDRTANNGSLGTIDLTQAGLALDWIKPLAGDLVHSQKQSATALSLGIVGTTFVPGSYNDDGYTFTWSGGEGASTSGTSIKGSNNTALGQNRGFRVTFTAPDAGDYVLKWYSGANNTQNWRLTGTWDSGPSDFQQAGANVGTTSGNGGVDEFFWTVNLTADTAGQVMTLDLVNTTTTNSALAITGITVAAVPEPACFGMLCAGAIALLSRRRSA